ncbi:MAG: ATP-binding protein [Smithella sp.]
MSPDHPVNWVEANQRYLTAAIAAVRQHLENYALRVGLKPEVEIATKPIPAENTCMQTDQGAPSALETLCTAFRLSPFERDILLLCAGVELDSSLAALVSLLSGDTQRCNPTFSLALATLPEPHWSALTPAAPLRRFRMIELSESPTLTSCPLKIDERILHYLAGIQYLDGRLNPLVEKFRYPGELTPSHRKIARRITDLCAQTNIDSRLPVIQLCGNDSQSKKDIAAWVCSALGLNLCIINAGNLPSDPVQLDGFLRLWEREAFLTQSALLVDCSESDPADKIQNSAVTRFIEATGGMILIDSMDRRRLEQRRQFTFDIMLPLPAEQRDLWITALGNDVTRLNGQLDLLAAQFQLSPRSIRASCDETLEIATDDFAAALWNTCRKQARPRLEQMAQLIEPIASWDDLVLPAMQKETLKAVAAHVRLRHRIYESWGFAAKSARGLGISALFTGGSGTGKTLAAEVLANDLKLDLFRIDLSQVVNKYIGETEKNLKRIFDAADAGGAILLFDEADALFGKRSEVKDSHDRYANIEVSYLLQRMESYRGLAILTTNMKEALDKAFLRRIRFIVQFPFPDAAQRAEIWRRIFPVATPTNHLDPERLSLIQVAGGNIRNIALAAAFLAADSNQRVDMTHIRQAVKQEYAKIEKQISASEMAAFNG